MPIPGITAGAGSSIPISAGGGTSGDAESRLTSTSAINIGGLFARGSQGATAGFAGVLPLAIVGGILLIAGFFLLRR